MQSHATYRPELRYLWLRIRIAILCAVLFLPLVVMLSPSLRGLTESRELTLPDWSWRVGSLRRYPAKFEEQFNAALPMRQGIAALCRNFYVDWLRVSPIPEAIVGANGWLYFTDAPSSKLLDRYVRGRDPFSQDELDRWRRLLLERTRYFHGIGAQYLFVVAPNKESIYPEHLPAWIGPRLGPTRSDQLFSYLKSVPELAVLDLRPSLIADKSAAMLYHKTDTHWNKRGAFAAYREIARVLAPDFPGLVIRDWESFNPRVIKLQGMDIAKMIGIGGAVSDVDFQIDRTSCSSELPLSVPLPQSLQSRMSAPAYSTTCDVAGSINAAIFYDSFGSALVPFLEESFSSTQLFRVANGKGKNYSVGYDMLKTLKVNLVVELSVERSLSQPPEY